MSEINDAAALYLAMKHAGVELTDEQVAAAIESLRFNRWRLRFVECRKVAYPAEREAKRHLSYELRHGRRSYIGMHAYQCPDCAKWHLGHSRKAA